MNEDWGYFIIKLTNYVFLRYCEERPLLLSNVGMGARLCTYYQKSSPDDHSGALLRNTDSSLGHIISLDPADKSPFLGDLKPGSSQSSLETNMYRAPIFAHKVPPTDYLLVRSPKGKLSLRRIDKVNVVGQQVSTSLLIVVCKINKVNVVGQQVSTFFEFNLLIN